MSELFGIGNPAAPAGTSTYWSGYSPTTFRLPSGKIRTAGDPNTAAYIRSNMGGVAVNSSMQPRYSPSAQIAAPSTTPSVAKPTAPSTQPNTQAPQNAAMVNALRQKPIRFAGFGMGTNATTPQSQNVNLSNPVASKMPNGLFQSF